MTDFLLEGSALTRLQEAVRLFGQQKLLAERAGIPATTLSQIVSKGGDVSVSRLGRIAAALGKPIDYFFSGAVEISDGSTVEVREIDLAYGLGSTFLDDTSVAETYHTFAASWVRQYTTSSADQLAFARGIGDSMAPTILDHDTILIDMAQNTPRIADKIWVLTWGGMGMVKRLRSRPDGGLVLSSDNPLVGDEVAFDGEAHVIGRVVAIVRKM